MPIGKMIAIEYNVWMSLMKMFDNKIKSLVTEYDGFNNDINIPILPAHPRNLSTLTKPSIIVQKVSADNKPISVGGFIGQHYDDTMNAYLDVYGANYDMTFQIDICGDSNSHRSLIEAMMIDGIFNDIRFSDGGNIEIYNYASSLNNPQLMGYAKIDPYLDIQNIDKRYRPDTNEYKVNNNDYVTVIRFDVNMIQVVIPDNQDLVDLTKWIHVTQRVKLN